MDNFYPIIEALFNALTMLITAISKFDIMAIDTQKLALAGQFVADTGRLVAVFARAIARAVSQWR